MKKILPVIFVLAFNASQAQITLNSSDFPSANDMYLMSDATAFQGMDASLTGANYSWDFSQLSTTTTGQHTDTLFTVTNMNIIYQAVFGDFGFLPNRSNQATHGMDFSLGATISITNVFNFYYNNSNDYHQSGFGAEINSVPLPTAYSPHDVIYKYPVQFGNLDSSASGYSVSLPNLIYYGVNRNRINEVDGWGTLITPNGTFNALRLKSTIHEHDSVFLDTLGFGYGFNVPEQIEYKWLGQGEGEPLLQVNVTGGVVVSVVYKGENNLGLTDAIKNDFEFVLYPNPAAGQITAKYSLQKKNDVVFSLVDEKGGSVLLIDKKNELSGDHVLNFDLPSNLAAGNYFLKMTSGNSSVTKPLSIR
ncbi:hypothetical protein BH11BAC1_BH11BAC1_05210 [soil metagenome]